jgi:ABC-2 type transport system ATP-binding protein
LARVADVLRPIDHGEVHIDRATHQVRVAVAGGGLALMNALRAVEAGGVEVEDVALRQPKLDGVFLALTGQSNSYSAPEATAS